MKDILILSNDFYRKKNFLLLNTEDSAYHVGSAHIFEF